MIPASPWRLLSGLRAQSSTDPGDLFVSAYTTAKEAEKAEQAGNFKTALNKFRYAAGVLDSIAAKFPTWQPLIVSFRKQQTSEALARVQEKVAKFGPGKGGDGGGLEGGLPTADDPLNFAPPNDPTMEPAPAPARSTRRVPPRRLIVSSMPFRPTSRNKSAFSFRPCCSA